MERERIYQADVEWQCDLYHFLASDARVAKEISEVFRKSGLAGDEFKTTGG